MFFKDFLAFLAFLAVANELVAAYSHSMVDGGFEVMS